MEALLMNMSMVVLLSQQDHNMSMVVLVSQQDHKGHTILYIKIFRAVELRCGRGARVGGVKEEWVGHVFRRRQRAH